MKIKLLILPLLILLTSCTNYNSISVDDEPTEAEISSAIEEANIPASVIEESVIPAVPEESVAEREITEPPVENVEPLTDRSAREILESIKSGDYEKVAEYVRATDAQAYQFIREMTVDSYEIVETIEQDENTKYFKVKFNILKSENQYFTAGESYWDLVIIDGPAMNLFAPSSEENLKYSDNGQLQLTSDDKGYLFCVVFSLDFGIYKTATDFNAAITNIWPRMWSAEDYMENYGEDWKNRWNRDLVHNSIHFYGGTAPDSNQPFSADTVENYVIKTTGITNVDYAVVGDDGFSSICEGHGGSWVYWRPVSKKYDENTKQYAVVINYYADSFLFVTAKTMEYKYIVNDDETYKMLSTEVLYDSGYAISGGQM